MALLSEQDLALVKSLSSRLASYDYGNEKRRRITVAGIMPRRWVLVSRRIVC